MGDAACLLIHNSTESCCQSEEARQYWLQLYTQDIVVKKPARPISHSPGIRQEIFQFSPASRNRLLHVCRNSGHLIKSQFLLTYPSIFPTDGDEVKRHLNAFLVDFRRNYKGEHYLWVLEFQERGAPHMHFFSSLDVTESARSWLGKTWVRIIQGGDDALRFHLHKNNFFPWAMKSGSYLAKEYLAKSAQKDVPENYRNVGRWWGQSRSMIPKSITINPDEVEDATIASRLRSSIRIITKRFEKSLYAHAAAAVSKRREKAQEKGKSPHISKRNRRKKIRSYTMPLVAPLFAAMLPFINHGGLYL